MFGRGVYFADKFSKSANYCHSYKAPFRFIFLNHVAVGRMYETYDSMPYVNKPPDGYHSVWAKEGRSLYNNEYIVYKPSQATITYMVLFER
jgi:poly [ADP-ribose] polymerase